MNYYHTEEGNLPTITKWDYNGYKFEEVLGCGEDRFRTKRKALVDYKAKLRQHIVDCEQALKEASEQMEMDTDRVW